MEVPERWIDDLTGLRRQAGMCLISRTDLEGKEEGMRLTYLYNVCVTPISRAGDAFSGTKYMKNNTREKQNRERKKERERKRERESKGKIEK